MQKNMFKTTKANLKWMQVNEQKMEILYQHLNYDEIRVVAGYIGSCSHDNKAVCETCGSVLSLKYKKLTKRGRTSYHCNKTLD